MHSGPVLWSCSSSSPVSVSSCCREEERECRQQLHGNLDSQVYKLFVFLFGPLCSITWSCSSSFPDLLSCYCRGEERAPVSWEPTGDVTAPWIPSPWWTLCDAGELERQDHLTPEQGLKVSRQSAFFFFFFLHRIVGAREYFFFFFFFKIIARLEFYFKYPLTKVF